jgi:hypothetical protein
LEDCVVTKEDFDCALQAVRDNLVDADWKESEDEAEENEDSTEADEPPEVKESSTEADDEPEGKED